MPENGTCRSTRRLEPVDALPGGVVPMMTMMNVATGQPRFRKIAGAIGEIHSQFVAVVQTERVQIARWRSADSASRLRP